MPVALQEFQSYFNEHVNIYFKDPHFLHHTSILCVGSTECKVQDHSLRCVQSFCQAENKTAVRATKWHFGYMLFLLEVTSDLFLSDRKKKNQTQVKNNPVLVVSLPELSAGRQLNASFVFSLCCQWERLQTVPLYAYEGLRARVSAVSICSANRIPLCVWKHTEDVATVWRRAAFIGARHCVNFPLTGGQSHYSHWNI